MEPGYAGVAVPDRMVIVPVLPPTTVKGVLMNVPLRFRFNAAFAGPLVGSVGLESDNNYLRGCLASALDLSIARNIRFGKGRVLQLRADIFNAPNEGRITGRSMTMNLSSPADPVTISNLPFDPVTGLVAANRVRPNQAGFGAVNGYQAPRTVQGQVRFSF